MVPTFTVVMIAVVAFVVGLIFHNLFEFFWYVDSPDDRDDLIDKLKKGLLDVQQKLSNVKSYTHEVQVKYVDAERKNIDMQIKYDELVRQFKAVMKGKDESHPTN